MRIAIFKQILLIVLLLSPCIGRADILTQFDTSDGFATGDTGFTLTDPEDPNFGATFGSPGEVVFFAFGPLYMDSNRAFGLEGGDIPTTSEIVFDTLASSVFVMGRNTNGETAGGPSTSEPPGTILPTADGSVEAFDENNFSLGKFSFTDDDFSNFAFDGRISRLEITNSGPANSYALIGGFGATAIPEPASTLPLVILSVLVRRRR